MELGRLIQQDHAEAWVDFSEDSKVLLRYVTREELARIYRESKKTVFKNHQREEETDSLKADKLLGRAAVRDWQGFTLNGESLPCTSENIDLLMSRWVEFSRFVNEQSISFSNFCDEDNARIGKN